MNNVSELLELQIGNVNNLLNVLKEETLAIASKKAVDIESIAKKKLTVIDEVKKQDHLLAQSLKNNTPSPENFKQISHIKFMLNQCHQHNDANGIALQRASLSMHKLRNLFEESIGKKEMTYDEKGKASGASTLGTNIKT